MAVSIDNLTIGMADITVDGVAVPHQADASTLNVEPEMIEIDLYELVAYDQRVNGYNVELAIVVDEENYNGLKLALSGVEEIVDSTTGETIGLQDAPVLQSLRANAKEVVVHPRDMGSATDNDITIFKAIEVGSFERSYGKEKTTYQITLKGLCKTADATQPGNYFLFGNASA
jgi:hypothetical protein